MFDDRSVRFDADVVERAMRMSIDEREVEFLAECDYKAWIDHRLRQIVMEMRAKLLQVKDEQVTEQESLKVEATATIDVPLDWW